MSDTYIWLREIRVREEDKKGEVLKDSKFEVVRLVATRMCTDMDALATDIYEQYPEPLRWRMHGGPGTEKTHKSLHIVQRRVVCKGIDMGSWCDVSNRCAPSCHG